MPTRYQIHRRGFTTAELLVGALIVLILLIAVSPFYRAAKAEAARVRCVAARRLIADAQEQYRAMSKRHVYARDLQALAIVLPAIPRCPEGGRYQFRKIAAENDPARENLVILCTYDGHKAYTLPSAH